VLYPDIQGPASICFSGAKEVFVPGLIGRQLRRLCRAGMCIGKASHPALAGSDRHRCGTKEAAALLVNFLRECR